MNLTIASGSAIAVLLAVALTGALALGMIALYLYHQRREWTNNNRVGSTSPSHDREQSSLSTLIAVTWEIEDALSLIERRNGLSTDVPIRAIVSAANRGGHALVDLGASGDTDRLIDSYRAMRRLALALDAAYSRANGGGSAAVPSDAIADLRASVENVERLARSRSSMFDHGR